jgi:chromosome segregation ATPase
VENNDSFDLSEKNRTRIDRIEHAIEKLTDISSDLNKMIAVHDQRLMHNEKTVSNIEEILEKRREEAEIKLKDVYDTIRSEDRNIILEITNLKAEAAAQYEKISHKISDMQKFIWTYTGALTIIAFLLSYGGPLIRLLSTTAK